MSGNSEKETMIRTRYWSIIAACMLLALAFTIGCANNPATVTPGAVTTVTSQAPQQQNAVVGSAFGSPLAVIVTTNGTPVSGSTVTFTAPGTGASGTFAGGAYYATATTNSSGIATSPAFTANSIIGTYIVTASALATQSTSMFDMANTSQPAGISVGGGTPQSASISQQFASTFSVTVTDSSSKSVGANLPVSFTAPSGNGTFIDSDTNVSTVLTNANGVATSAPYVAGASAASPYTVVASTVDGDSATVSFTVANTIVPATITASAGTTPQSATAGTPFAVPLQVTIVDGSTTPVPVANALVTFAAPAFTLDTNNVPSTASGTFAGGSVTTTVWTDSNGVATAPVFTANTLAGGPYNVSATVVIGNGKNLSLNFALTNQ